MKKLNCLFIASFILFSAVTNLISNSAEGDNWLVINGGEFNNTKVIMKPAADLDDNSIVYTTGNDMSNLILGASYNDKPCNVVANINGNKIGTTQSIYINVQVGGVEYISTSPVSITFNTYGAVGTIVSGSFTASLMSMATGRAINAEVHFAAMRKTDM